MKFRDCLKYVLYDLITYREYYIKNCGAYGPNLNVILKYIET